MNATGRKVALITGASSGIGFELAKLFARDGYALFLTARDSGRLHAASETIRTDLRVTAKELSADLSDPESAHKIHSWTKNAGVEIDVLVNNAGYGVYGKFTETPDDAETDMLETNVVSLTKLTKYYAKDMAARKSGRILNVASTAAFQPGPLMAGYYASKAYVLSFSLALAEELRGSGVTVTTLCPGLTKTRFHDRAHIVKPKMFGEGASAQAVAKAGYAGLMKGEKIVIPGIGNKALASLARLTPMTFSSRVAKWFQEERR